jgi:hypothetical protein
MFIEYKSRNYAGVGLLAAAICAAVGYFALHREPAPPQKAAIKPEQTIAAPAAMPAPVAAVASVAQKPSAEPVVEGYGAQVKTLLADGSPTAKLAAYKLLAQCAVNAERKRDLSRIDASSPDGAMARDRMSQFYAETEQHCVDVQPVDIAQRMALLEAALASGSPEAARTYWSAGPYGDPTALESRPDDPLVVAWKERALTALNEAARHGDVETMSFLSSQYLMGDASMRDISKALGYEMAAQQAREAQQAPPLRGQDRLIARLRMDATPAQIKQAETFAKDLTRACCSARS